MNNEVIKLSKISKKFVKANKNIIVLKNINFKINKGELVSLTGPFWFRKINFITYNCLIR